MIKQRMRRDLHGDVQVTIVITGTHDVYRLAHHLTYGQCEFADAGRSILGKLRRRMGRDRWAVLTDYMHGSGVR